MDEYVSLNSFNNGQVQNVWQTREHNLCGRYFWELIEKFQRKDDVISNHLMWHENKTAVYSQGALFVIKLC